MSESEIHARLVGAMLGAIQQYAPRGQLYIWADQHRTQEHRQPYTVGSVRADVVAIRKDTRLVIIGEAKTRNDIDNAHTHKQLKDYYEHLVTQPDGLLWLSVPLGSGGEALRVSKTVRREVKCERVALVVSEWLLGECELESRWHG